MHVYISRTASHPYYYFFPPTQVFVSSHFIHLASHFHSPSPPPPPFPILLEHTCRLFFHAPLFLVCFPPPPPQPPPPPPSPPPPQAPSVLPFSQWDQSSSQRPDHPPLSFSLSSLFFFNFPSRGRRRDERERTKEGEKK